MTAFAPFEWMIAWRYLRARRAEGGVSVMTWITLIGITLAVFALIAVMAVRAGFRMEFVDTILGSNAHMTVYAAERVDEHGRPVRGFADYPEIADQLRAIPGVTRAAPMVKATVMATFGERSTGAQVYGMAREDVASIPRIGRLDGGASAFGDLGRLDEGVAIGSGVARDLGVTVGDRIRLISPNGPVNPMGGRSPRVNAYEVVYIFTAGRYDIDNTRAYLPLAAAQSFFNREGLADEFEVMVQDPDHVETLSGQMLAAGGPDALLWSWRDSAGAFLNALKIEDNVMFVIMAVLVLIATLNIVSGLIMLVKNKGRDIGILRTMGLTEGSVLRVFFLCGAATGIVGTALGVVLGCLFALNIDAIFAAVNWASGGQAWDPSIRGIYYLPARLQAGDVLTAVGLSLTLSFAVTWFPARRAARLNPVEALRYE
jgi:lipoprotein-releasing system permease protein